jgi:hypothetical protein
VLRPVNRFLSQERYCINFLPQNGNGAKTGSSTAGRA